MMLFNRNSWTVKEQAIFYKRLGYLLKRGYTLSTAIEFLMLHQSSKKKGDLKGILLRLTQGTPIYSVFNTLGFSRDGLSYIFFAVKHGDLSTGLLNAGELLDKKMSYKNKLYKVMRYPMFLIIFVIALSTIMQTILLPQFMELHESINLPQSSAFNLLLWLQMDQTQILIPLLVVFLLVTVYYMFIFRKKSPIGKQRILGKTPLVGHLTCKYNTYFFSFHLGTLLASGLSINEALTVFEEQNHLLFFKEESKRIRGFLIEGDQLENILRDTAYYENELATIIVHGQANGILANELLDYSQMVIERLEETFKLWLRILQPTIIIFVGLLVVLMYLAVMLPLYEMMQNL